MAGIVVTVSIVIVGIFMLPHYSSVSRNKANEALIGKQEINWKQADVKEIQESVKDGHAVSRLTPSHAAMSDLEKYLPEWEEKYEKPELKKKGDGEALLIAPSKEKNKYLRLVLHQLASEGKHGAWFLVRIEVWEE